MTQTIHAFQPKNAAAGDRRPPRWDLATQRVYVVFTTMEATLAAVRIGSRLSRAVGGRLVVVHFRTVAFGSPVEAPSGVSPVQTEEFTRRVEAEECDAEIKVCLCRDPRTALATVVKERSLVLVGRPHRWWPTAADRWRRALESAGHIVVTVDEDGSRA